jgi:hypothetical protein
VWISVWSIGADRDQARSVSADHEIEAGVDALQVVSIAGYDCRPKAPRQQRHTRVDDVATSALTAQHANGLRFIKAERMHGDKTRSKQPGEARLALSITPNLGNDASRHVQGPGMNHRQLYEGTNPGVVTFERDQGAGV